MGRHKANIESKLEDLRLLILEDSSASDTWRYIQDESQFFGVISAYLDGDEENPLRHNDLKAMVRKRNLGYIEVQGGYEKVERENSVEIGREEALIVFNISRKTLIRLAKQYEQEHVIYRDASEFSLISTHPRSGAPEGSVLLSFEKQAGESHLDLAKRALRSFFAPLLKGTHVGQRLVFRIEERIYTGWISRYIAGAPFWVTIHEEEIEVER